MEAATLPEAWEKAVLDVYDYGVDVSTEYDQLGDPPSKDAMTTIVVQRPFKEPMIHKNFPGGPAELEIYRQEVVSGIHDHWIDPDAGKWTYTYHQRLNQYDQLQYMAEKLADVPYSRRAQAVTWEQKTDPSTDDPPCCQRVWARLLPDEDGFLTLDFHTHWRSRDLYKAWFMNAFAFIDLQDRLACEVAALRHEPVQLGSYVDTSDSLHIYGSYMDEKFEDEIAKIRDEDISTRVWNSSVLEPMFEETRAKLEEDPDYMVDGA